MNNNPQKQKPFKKEIKAPDSYSIGNQHNLMKTRFLVSSFALISETHFRFPRAAQRQLDSSESTQLRSIPME